MANLLSWILWLHTILMGPSQLQSIERWHMRTNILISNPTTSWPKRLQCLEHSFLGLSHCAHMLQTRTRKWAMWRKLWSGMGIPGVLQRWATPQNNRQTEKWCCVSDSLCWLWHDICWPDRTHPQDPQEKKTFKSLVRCRSSDFSPGKTCADLSPWHCMERINPNFWILTLVRTKNVP